MTSVIDLSSQVRSFELGTVDFRLTWGCFGLSQVIFLELSDSQVYISQGTVHLMNNPELTASHSFKNSNALLVT